MARQSNVHATGVLEIFFNQSAGIAAYTHHLKKPSINLEEKDRVLLMAA